ncbi:hypothetical protein RND81_03G103500 [Saponaria officinalis]|uniref:Uncharacterized protein n=1 Tax=Saponaria officinalis TaxID=3572 RepID=A0AAW1M5X9_SAPOF
MSIIWLFIVVTVGAGVLKATQSVPVTNDVNPDCPRQCGSLTVNYPFGIGPRCSFSPLFSLECDDSFDPPKTFTKKLDSSSTRSRVFNISESEIIVNGLIAFNCPPSNGTRKSVISSKKATFLPHPNSPFTISNRTNTFSLAGSCGYTAPTTIHEDAYECPKSCEGRTTDGKFMPGTCFTGNRCCSITAAESLENGFSMKVEFSKNHTTDKSHTTCGYVVFGMKDSLVLRNVSDYSDPITFVDRTTHNVPMAVDWVIGNQTCDEARKNPLSYACQQNADCTDVATGGYRCTCSQGYEGNPYFPGCTDKDECSESGDRYPCSARAKCKNREGDYTCSCRLGYRGDGLKQGSGCKPISVVGLTIGSILGLICLIVVGSATNILIQKHKSVKMREKFFTENGGLVLLEKLSSSNRGRSLSSFQLFKIEELKKSTKNFSKDLVVGVGGYGTVYKGTLQDGTVIAVKKSKSMDITQIEQFINEMVILTQIHHRNVVRLLGCCLEAQIPILVYEFVINGSLQDHIHAGSNWLNWNNRLRIATEVATALGYLHSAASTSVIH